MNRVLHRVHQIHVFARDAARELDRLAVQEFGIPGIVLMENAAIALAQTTRSMIEQHNLTRVVICCGPGNNGGDGLALARHLANHGVDPLIVMTTPAQAMKGDAGVNARIVEAMGLRVIDPVLAMSPQAALEIVLEDGPIAPSDDDARRILIVDALLGTGLDRPVEHPLDKMVGWVNAMHGRGARVLSVDIPSGMDCDSGVPLGACVQADATLTLGGVKLGFLQPDAPRFTGRVLVGDIGVPLELLRRLAWAR